MDEQGEFYVTDADSDEEPEGTQQEYYVDIPDTDEELEGTHQTTEVTQPTEDTQPMEGTQPTEDTQPMEGTQPTEDTQPMEGTQPMEDPVVTSSTYEHDVDGPTSGRLTWTIENFSRLNAMWLYSDSFSLGGGYQWRLLMFPKGCKGDDHLWIYLDVADSSELPSGWIIDALFSISVVNHIQDKMTAKECNYHKFTERESKSGLRFMPLIELNDPNRGFLVSDKIVVEATVTLCEKVDYDSKKETGYVGLRNQGATCYMNSLLQMLYHIHYFREAVYHMPATENDKPSGSVTLALQSLFRELQYSDDTTDTVATKELTESFGWDSDDSFMQRDVHEFNRVLCEKLEEKMEGTIVEGTIQQLFEGHHKSYTECINVDYRSYRVDSFYDIQLEVKGCQDVYASFDKYVEAECFEGENKYHTGQYGLQDARRCVLFIDFPPVLQLHLKRFEYDFSRQTMVKINDRYEFPLQLDLDRENGKYLSPEADRSVRNLYTLYSVLVHSGRMHDGHYYAYIRPNLSDKWFKFDDENVTTATMKAVLEDQCGGEEEFPRTLTNARSFNSLFKITKFSNAYMLVYIRENDKNKIMCNVDEKDIADESKLKLRIKEEQEEEKQKRKEMVKGLPFTTIKVIRDKELSYPTECEQTGSDMICFDLVNPDAYFGFCFHEEFAFKLFKEEVAVIFDIPSKFQRFWLWTKRKNHTYHPNRPLTLEEEDLSVGKLSEVSNEEKAELTLFMEVELGQDWEPIPLPEKTKEDILLFFKRYDPLGPEIRYVGRLFVKASSKPLEILTKVNELACFSPDEDIELFGEVKLEPYVMLERIPLELSFRDIEIEDGDMICIQKSHESRCFDQCRFRRVNSFLNYVRHYQVIVRFRSLEKPREDVFSLEFSKEDNYDKVIQSVARYLGLDDPLKIRLTSHNYFTQGPMLHPIKYRGVRHLLDMLIHHSQVSNILYYQVLDIQLPKLEDLKTLKVAFCPAKIGVTIYTIMLTNQSTVSDVLDDLKTKVELSHPDAELRLLEIFYHKIRKIFPPHERIGTIDHHRTLRAEEIPEEEKNLGPHDHLIHVYHFMDTTQNEALVTNFGEPFILVLHEGETLAEIKARIQKKLQVLDDEFLKWKFALVSRGYPKYLEDSDILSKCFEKSEVCSAWEKYLGMEHTDNAPKSPNSSIQNPSKFEKDKPLRIYN